MEEEEGSESDEEEPKRGNGQRGGGDVQEPRRAEGSRNRASPRKRRSATMAAELQHKLTSPIKRCIRYANILFTRRYKAFVD